MKRRIHGGLFEIRLFNDAGVVHPHLAVFHRDEMVARDDYAEHEVAPEDRLELIIGIAGGAEDVRMRGFRERAAVEDARNAALADVARLGSEEVSLADCWGRVLAEDVMSRFDVPAFRRATMDGFAVHASDTFGASPYNPARLKLVGESLPGTTPVALPAGRAALRIMTGAPVPAGADAVLRAEDASDQGDMVEIHAAVAPGKNVGRIGEDISVGDRAFSAGRRLRPQDVGLLSSIGHTPVSVVRRPVVRVIVSGDELLAPGNSPRGTSIVDSNSPMLDTNLARKGFK